MGNSRQNRGNVGKSVEELEAENEALRHQIASKAEVPDEERDKLTQYMGDIEQIKKKATVDSGTIQVKEISDHKNISLWTRDGKRIGPLHQSNALRAYEVFHKMGVRLLVERPTEEQIEEYKKTPEYKKAMEALAKRRAIKEKSRKSGTVEKYLAEIARMTGQSVEAIHKLVSAKDVKGLSSPEATRARGEAS